MTYVNIEEMGTNVERTADVNPSNIHCPSGKLGVLSGR